MYVAFVLRRKREGIAGTIAAYEARIDAAKMDLAVLEQSARCSIPKPNEARHLPLASGQGQARQRSRRQSVRIHGVLRSASSRSGPLTQPCGRRERRQRIF